MMRGVYLYLIAVSFGFALTPADPTPIPPAADVDVSTPWVNGKRDAGGGVAVRRVKDATLVVTCRHVVGASREVRVRAGGRNYTGEVVLTCGDRDLVVVRVKAVLPVAEFAPAYPRAGAPVTHEGASSGPASGKVLPERAEFAERRAKFHATLTAKSGDSGYPVYDSLGRVAAICCGLTEDGHLRGCPAPAARELVDEAAGKVPITDREVP